MSDSILMANADNFIRDIRNPIADRAKVIEYVEVAVMSCDSSRSSYDSDEYYIDAYLNT